MMDAFDNLQMPTILCCECGVALVVGEGNSSNMCMGCLRTRVNITEGISKHLSIGFCKGCGRFLNPPNHWIFAEPESNELLSICLKRIKGINNNRNIRLIDARFIWTEPHSMRLRLKITVEKEVFGGALLQQSFEVEFIIVRQQCDGCAKAAAKNVWTALVQLRQRVDHKRTIFLLEQLLLKHSAHAQCVNIKEKGNGLDFFFNHRSHARKFLDFVESVVPSKHETSRKLVTHDDKSNVYNYKYTFCCDIVPLCKDDLVCLPQKLARSLGGISPLMLVSRISNQIHLIDPTSLRSVDLSTQNYAACSFPSLCSQRQLIEFILLDVNITGERNGKFARAEVQIVRARDFGANDSTFFCFTHLGNLFSPGDSVLGYDLTTANFNDFAMDSLSEYQRQMLPDIILVKKHYPNRRKHRRRHWDLKRIGGVQPDDVKLRNAKQAEDQAVRDGHDMEMFRNELEDDPELRSRINLFKVPDAEKILQENVKEEEDNMEDVTQAAPIVPIEELLDGLSLNE